MTDSIINTNPVKSIIQDTLNKKISANPLNGNGSDLKEVAEKFEAIFVHQMLKQARQSKLAEGMFSSEAQDTFNNMLDLEYSQILSKKNNFGISDALIEQFQSHDKSGVK